MTPSAPKSAAHQVSQQVFVSRTNSITVIASAICKAFFPQQHKQATKIFKAGRWFDRDVGPWLGRAVGYKVPTTTHPDEGDSGTTFITAVGSYLGGYLEIHDLAVRFTYQPGHMVFGDFRNFFHRVSAWEDTLPHARSDTADLMRRHQLSPGRAFLVMFNKSETDERLKDKPAEWGRQTRFGADQVAPKIQRH